MDTTRRFMVNLPPMTALPPPDRPSARLSSARTVAIGTLWNLAGRLGPMLVAIAATPFLIAALGVSRFGIFSLALSLIGIFGIFDFGFGRALTRLVAERLAAGDEAHAAPAVLSGLVLMTGLGVIGGGVLAVLARAYALHLLDLPPPLAAEVSLALMLLCASAPLVVLNAALWGVLSAYQRFSAANIVNLPIMALYYLGPLAILPFFDSLVAVIAVLVGCRAVMTIAYAAIVLDTMPTLRTARPDWRATMPLLRFGGWLTVSNLAWPALLYLDRFVIAAAISAEAAAWYATPFDLILRFTIIPIAIMQSGFPALATTYRDAPEAAARLVRLATIAILATLFPAALLAITAASPLLTLWLGAPFAAHAAPVLQILGVGVLFMCADTVPVGMLDAIGRPELNAKLAFATLLLALPLLAILIPIAGIEGAALAWTLRVIATFIARLWLCHRHYPALAPEFPRLLPPLAAALLAIVASLYSAPAAIAGSALLAVVMWTRGLAAGERMAVFVRFRLGK